MADEDIEPVKDVKTPYLDPEDPRSRKDRPTGSTHFGDIDFEVEDEVGDATWGEVCRICCCHTPVEWAWIGVGILIVCMFLYFFLFGLELLGGGAKVMAGCKAGELFGDDTNPIAGLMVGILATVLLQSSSTTTSIIVSLVGSAITVDQGIYMVMGANIGTSVTNTIVALGQMGDGDQLERAFAGAVVHDMFNFMTVAILLPVEVITGYLNALTAKIVQNFTTNDGEKWEGPVKKIVAPLGNKVIIANKKVIEAVAKGDSECNAFYPIVCEDPSNPTKDTCKTGLIACDKKSGDCPAFFDVNASRKDDQISGGVVFFIALVILFTCLIGLVTMLQRMLLGMSTRIVYKATDVNGYIAIAIGCGITMVVQSSSITTSTLTPLVGMGALRLEQMYPLTLGANIGTTLTALLAALVAEGTDPLQVALAHLFFNISGIIIFYPIPFMRNIPIYSARQLGKTTRIWKGFPIVYIFVMFFLVPLLFLGLSSLFEQDTKGFTVLGGFLCAIIGCLCIYLGYWCQFKNGRQKCVDCMAARQRRRTAERALPDDMDYLKAKIAALVDHTGLPVEEDEDEEEDAEDVKKMDDDDDEDEEVAA